MCPKHSTTHSQPHKKIKIIVVHLHTRGTITKAHAHIHLHTRGTKTQRHHLLHNSTSSAAGSPPTSIQVDYSSMCPKHSTTHSQPHKKIKIIVVHLHTRGTITKAHAHIHRNHERNKLDQAECSTATSNTKPTISLSTTI